jgi:AcrR family transcriptional regulator
VDRAARSREALCDAAFELFTVRGFDATTAEQIAERAGVSPRTFFRYFPT